jgi:hypothetical protein
MKKLIFLLLTVYLFSCSNKSSLKNKENLSDSMVKTYSTSSLIKEKFIEFYDLSTLYNQKTQFKRGIEVRLKSFMIDTNHVFIFEKGSKINKIKIEEKTDIDNNPTDFIKVFFEIKNGEIVKQDSIIAMIMKKHILLDSKNVISTKIKFSRFNPL